MKLALLSVLAGTACGLSLSLAAPPEDYEIVLWNQYNGDAKDRGTKVCKVEVFSGGSSVWKQDRVEMNWKPGAESKVSVKLPKQIWRFDRIRVGILETVGNGGGLAEIEVLRGGVNIARSCQVSASGFFKDDQRFAPKRVIDGITSSENMFVGYWLLPDQKTGWIELKLPNR